MSALPYGTTEEYQDIIPKLVNPETENLSGHIVGCLYVNMKEMKELEEKMAARDREAQVQYEKLLMSASCASIMQM